MIYYLKRNQLDDNKYNSCIKQSKNSRIYAFSWYLDCVADNWDALVLNDYEAVMPLPWRQKYVIKYIYPPAWTQQLGVFSPNENFTPVQDVLLTESYFFMFPDLSPDQTYIYKLFITVDGVPSPATTDVYWLTTGPNGIEEILAKDPNIVGGVYNVAGSKLADNVRPQDLKTHSVGFGNQIIMWRSVMSDGKIASLKLSSH